MTGHVAAASVAFGVILAGAWAIFKIALAKFGAHVLAQQNIPSLRG
jgi:hypothetical protein